MKTNLLIGVMVLVCGLFVSELQAEITPVPSGWDMEYSLVTDKAVYNLGETVYATHTITNQFDVPVEVDLRNEPGFNLLIKQGETEIYSAVRGFAQVTWTRTFDPAEILEFSYTWDMTDYDGNSVLPGEYELVGVVYGGGNTSATITIVPEPGTLGLLLLGGLGLLRRRKNR